jgi:hypothetical protein
MRLSNILLLGSLALPAAIAGQFQPGLAVRIYVPIEAKDATVTAKILGPDVETMSSATFNETNTICHDESLIGIDVTVWPEFCLDKSSYIGVTRLEGILADEVRSVNISMPDYNLTVSLKFLYESCAPVIFVLMP